MTPAQWLREALAKDGTVTATGIAVDEMSAMQVVTVNACVRLIAETCASLPFKTFTKRTDTRGRTVRTETNYPQERHIWKRPNPTMTKQFFIETILGHMLLWGNAYVFKQRDRAERIQELWPIRPDRVSVAFDARRGRKLFEVRSEDGTSRVLSSDHILHIPGFSLDGVIGLSPITSARLAIALHVAAEEFGAGFFKNGSTLSGILSVPGKLNDEDAKRLLRLWDMSHAGVGNAFKPAVLDNQASWTQLGVPPEDSQFMEVRRFQVTEIARLYRVPPHLIADVSGSTSWGTGIEEQNHQFVMLTLLPWLIRIEQAFTDELTTAEDRYVKFSVDGLLRGKTEARLSAYKEGWNMGMWSINDLLVMEDRNPLDDEWADEHFVPMNMTTASALAASAKQMVEQAENPPADPNADPNAQPSADPDALPATAPSGVVPNHDPEETH